MSSKTYLHFRRQLLEKARALRDALIARDQDTDLIMRLSRSVTAIIARLQNVISFGEIRRILAGAGLAVALQVASADLAAQTFASPLTNPFGLETVYNGAWIDAADIDHDGDLDVFVGAYEGYSAQLYYFENTGTPEEPVFADPVINPFGISGDFDLYMPELADIDNDGDLDLFATYVYGLVFLENTGDAENPAFAAPVDAPFGFEQPYDTYIYRPNLADLDGDGDLDLLTGAGYDYSYSPDYNAGIYYFENTGSVTEPQFAEGLQNPFGMTWVYYLALPALADLDSDGDLDLLIGDFYAYYGSDDDSKLVYFENTGDAENPQFTNRQENPFGLSGGNYLSYPCFADMDHDGDLDLFVGQTDPTNDAYGSFLYFENIGTSSVQEIVDSDRFKVSPNPARDHLVIHTDLIVQSIELIDALGRVHTPPATRSTVDISQLPSGIAVMRASTKEGHNYLRKVLIVK